MLLMGFSVGVNPPKTPCTKGSHGKAKNTIPNVCKMPGPPAPFVPTPLPNIGKSELAPKGYSTTVKIEGQAVAIRGATFESIGDVASKGTGGGLISANTQGPTKFITPGSMNVKIEGKNVHQLGEPMLNNCGPSGSPPNTGATMSGLDQDTTEKIIELLTIVAKACDQAVNDQWDKDHPKGPKHSDCLANSGEMMNTKKGLKPKPVQVKLGELKEACVNNALGKDPGILRSQEAFDPDGTPIGKSKPYGSAIPQKGGGIPDFCVASDPLNSSQDLEAIFELKFPCKEGKKKGNLSDNQVKNWPKLFNCPIIIIP
jgi:uncharacterized Zn-binding protein involved in type VI secretion